MRRAALAALLLAGCGRAPAPAPPVVVPVAAPAPERKEPVAIPIPPPDAGPPEPVLPAMDARCRGEVLRLEAVRQTCRCQRDPADLSDGWCGFDAKRDPDRVRAAMKVTVDAPAEVKPGASFDVTVRATNTSSAWVMVMVPAEWGNVSTEWEDEHGREIPIVDDPTCRPVAMLSLLQASVVALPPGGRIEATAAFRATKKRSVGRRWKPRNAAESAVVRALVDDDCAVVDDAPFAKGAYQVVVRFPFEPYDLANFGRARANVRVQ